MNHPILALHDLTDTLVSCGREVERRGLGGLAQPPKERTPLATESADDPTHVVHHLFRQSGAPWFERHIMQRSAFLPVTQHTGAKLPVIDAASFDYPSNFTYHHGRYVDQRQ